MFFWCVLTPLPSMLIGIPIFTTYVKMLWSCNHGFNVVIAYKVLSKQSFLSA